MLKLVLVFSHESRVETIDRLARQELDGMSLDKIDAIIEALRYERYQWLPARRTYIPKKNGKKRPLGMPVWSDKLVQEVIHLILEAYYEPQFSDHSHGFRPERGCHTALREIYQQWTGTSWFKEGQDSATGEPCALKGACTVRRRADRKGLAEILP
jgi:retron-type reverse transcriptase